jgi:hypothetical protein
MIRSLSFTRSSPAPRTTVSPSAKAPSSATNGISSIAIERRGSDVELADGLLRDEGPGLLQVSDDDRAHPLRDPEEARPRPVEADRVDHDPRIGDQGGCGDPERRRRRIAGDGHLAELELVEVRDA